MKSFFLEFEMIMNFNDPVHKLASHLGCNLGLPTHVFGVDFAYARLHDQIILDIIDVILKGSINGPFLNLNGFGF